MILFIRATASAFVAGADAVEAIAKKAESLKVEATAYGELSTNMGSIKVTTVFIN